MQDIKVICNSCISSRTSTDVEPGTVVVTNRAFNAYLKEEHETVSIHVHMYQAIECSTIKSGLVQFI